MDDASALTIAHALLGVGLITLGFFAANVRKHARSNHTRMGEAYFWLLVVTLGSSIAVGAQHPGVSVFELATPPALLLGVFGCAMAKRRPRWWLGRPR